MYKIQYSNASKKELKKLLKNGKKKKLNKLKEAFEQISKNPRHPGLHTHKYNTIKGINGEEIFQSYAENNTPGAYRIFWHYGPKEKMITLFAITPHP